MVFFVLTSESWKCKFHPVRRKPGYLLGFFYLKGSSDRNILINSSGGKIRYRYRQKAEVYFRKRILKISGFGAKQCNASWKNIVSCHFFNSKSDYILWNVWIWKMIFLNCIQRNFIHETEMYFSCEDVKYLWILLHKLWWHIWYCHSKITIIACTNLDGLWVKGQTDDLFNRWLHFWFCFHLCIEPLLKHKTSLGRVAAADLEERCVFQKAKWSVF